MGQWYHLKQAGHLWPDSFPFRFNSCHSIEYFPRFPDLYFIIILTEFATSACFYSAACLWHFFRDLQTIIRFGSIRFQAIALVSTHDSVCKCHWGHVCLCVFPSSTLYVSSPSSSSPSSSSPLFPPPTASLYAIVYSCSSITQFKYLDTPRKMSEFLIVDIRCTKPHKDDSFAPHTDHDMHNYQSKHWLLVGIFFKLF